ncbi:uncharacterized protein NEMAJ01_0543 [Nematocida major]|uniref:uncharacterized protein n=1 Tax=Nematocida major TaxID=1912982 RepID=UPI002008023A|nr:uncharacterized protein NEMAJ01_0543 [Nematocida major]KAH9385647.1 hypothetical protein NEMAJ01_0543 [Nematocida major]
MQYVITQLVISTPPDIVQPAVVVSVDGVEHRYTTESVLGRKRKAFIELDEFWLIYTDGIHMEATAKTCISIVNSGIIVGSIALSRIPLGIGRYYKKDFSIQRYLPNNLFLDIIVEEGAVSAMTAVDPGVAESLKRLAILSSALERSRLSIRTDSFSPETTSESRAAGSSTALSEARNGPSSGGSAGAGRSSVPEITGRGPLPRSSGASGIREGSSLHSAAGPAGDVLGKKCALPPPSVSGNASSEKPGASPRKLPPPPGMIVRPAVSQMEGVDLSSKTVFPRVGWNTVLSARGTVYESPGKDAALEGRWKEIEDEFKRKFCIKRAPQKAEVYKKERPVKAQTILSEKQEFLLSIVFESTRKSKVSLNRVSRELNAWIDAETPPSCIDSIVNLSNVFPSAKDCAKILDASHPLTEVEEKVKAILQSNCTQGKFLLIKYVQWADPSLSILISTLRGVKESLASIQKDREFPVFMALLLRLGNLVNYKYAETSSKSPAMGFSLSSVCAFSRCSSEPVSDEVCKMSLLEFLILTVRDKIDFNKMMGLYTTFRNIHLKSLKDHYIMIRSGYDSVSVLDSFPGKEERMHRIFLLIRECEYLISEIDSTLFMLSKSYADTPECIVKNMVDAFDCIEKYSYLFQ